MTQKDLLVMFHKQKQLDQEIIVKHHLQDTDLTEEKILSFNTELGELANTWRGFKYWSNNQKPKLTAKRKNGTEYNPLVDEYIDGIHFLMSLGFTLGYEPEKVVERLEFLNLSRIIFKGEITKQFNNIFRITSKLQLDTSLYIKLFNEYLLLGSLLGFEWQQIHNAYYQKLEVNHQRQNQGY